MQQNVPVKLTGPKNPLNIIRVIGSASIALFLSNLEIFQELNFMVEIVRAHAEAGGKAFLTANPGFREFLE